MGSRTADRVWICHLLTRTMKNLTLETQGVTSLKTDWTRHLTYFFFKGYSSLCHFFLLFRHLTYFFFKGRFFSVICRGVCHSATWHISSLKGDPSVYYSATWHISSLKGDSSRSFVWTTFMGVKIAQTCLNCLFYISGVFLQETAVPK